MQVITLTKVKELLGLSVTTYDSAITAAIPYVDSVVKQITRNRYNYRIVGSTTASSTEVVVSSNYAMHFSRYSRNDDLNEYIQTGQLISGGSIPADAYVKEVYYNIPEGTALTYADYTWTIDISAVATATASGVTIYLGIPIAYLPIIAKGVWWQTQQLNQTITDDAWVSKSMGPYSINRGGLSTSALDRSTGFPTWFVSAFPKYQGGH